MRRWIATASLTLASLIPVAAFPKEQPDCGLPPPIPTPFVHLQEPTDGAKDVPLKIDKIEASAPTGIGFALVAVSTYQPLTLDASETKEQVETQKWVLRIPQLRPNTRYELVYGFTDWQSEEPCFSPMLIDAGQFWTGPR